MKRIIEAIVEATNLAYMVRDEYSDKAKLQNAAEKVLRRLDNAVDCLAELKRGDK